MEKNNEDDKVDNTLLNVKLGGGSIMIWGCMFSKGVGNTDLSDRTTDKVVYNNILKWPPLWSSGKIVASHTAGPGSTPGRVSFPG